MRLPPCGALRGGVGAGLARPGACSAWRAAGAAGFAGAGFAGAGFAGAGLAGAGRGGDGLAGAGLGGAGFAGAGWGRGAGRGTGWGAGCGRGAGCGGTGFGGAGFGGAGCGGAGCGFCTGTGGAGSGSAAACCSPNSGATSGAAWALGSGDVAVSATWSAIVTTIRSGGGLISLPGGESVSAAINPAWAAKARPSATASSRRKPDGGVSRGSRVAMGIRAGFPLPVLHRLHHSRPSRC